MLTAPIPSYLYQQYADDDDLQAFVNAYNELTGVYVSWFALTPIAAYTNAAIVGALLDWVAAGVYGMLRPTLSSGQFRAIGPLNTWELNTWPLNNLELIGPSDVAVTSNDIFKRIITWNFYKGDGNRFNVRWLKRRIMRFLIGEDGTAPNIDNTYIVSVSFIGNGVVLIGISQGSHRLTGGAIPNMFGLNQFTPLNSITTLFTPGPNPLPDESVLQQAIEAGVLQLPFQYTYRVNISTG